jgi:hypothetical protein
MPNKPKKRTRAKPVDPVELIQRAIDGLWFAITELDKALDELDKVPTTTTQATQTAPPAADAEPGLFDEFCANIKKTVERDYAE